MSVRMWALWLILFGLTLPNLAQETPVPQVVPTITIESIVCEDSFQSVTVNLRYTAQHLINRLQVRVEKSRGNTLVSEAIYPIINTLDLATDNMARGEEYRLTVTGINFAGTPLLYDVQQSYGGVEKVDVKSIQTFACDAPESPTLEIRAPSFSTQDLLLKFDVFAMFGDEIVQYEAWLELDGGTPFSTEKVLLSGRDTTHFLPVAGAPAGKYELLLNALDKNGTVIASTSRGNIELAIPQPSLFDNLRGNPVLIGVVVVIALVLLGIVGLTFLRRPAREYQLERANFRASARDLMNTGDVSLYQIERNQRELLRQRQKARAQFTIRNTPNGSLVGQSEVVTSTPYTIGRENQHLSLPFATVSGRHATLHQEKNGFFIEDNGSRNGTLLNGTIISPNQRVPIRFGDTLLIGRDIELTFEQA